MGSKIKTGSKTIDGTWAFTETEYDNFDRAVKTSEPFFDGATKLWNETTFDSYGRPLEIKAATGKIAKYTYPDFLTVNVNDGTLNKTNVKNALGNVILLTDTPGGTITYKYFANGNLKQSTFGSAVTTITQDGWGRKIKLVEPSAGEYNYTYNGFGQALTETTPNGTTAYTYTNIGKLDTKWVKGKPSTDGTFSGTNILSTYSYYPNKMLEKITVTNPNDGNSVYNYTYDDYKRITYTKEEFTTIAPRKFENRIEYDEFGRTQTETSIATINGFSQTKTYFNEYKNGELFKKRENNASGNPIWTLNTRNARGQITSATLGDNIIAQTNTYHDLGHTLSTNYNKIATPTASILSLTNTYDYVQGNMLTRSNSMFAWNEIFKYDSLDRLTEFTNKLGAQTTQDYEDNGKIKSNFLGSYRYSSAKPYQNTSIKLTPEGQAEAGLSATQTIVYTAFKAPISILQSAQKVNFGYNFAEDRSVMYYGNNSADKLLRPMRRFYSADGTMEITQTVATNSYEFTTYIGGNAYSAPALARQTNNATSSVFYLHRDHLGTILAVTNNLGNVVEKRLFDAWGDIIKIQNGAGVALTKLTFLDRGYTGHEHLQSFRLINMNGRLYDPRLHRFLQPDNNLQEPYNTQNYNRYGYVLNNPLKYTDPTGEFTWQDLVAGVAVVAGAILCFVPGLQVIGGSLLITGLSHFKMANDIYKLNGGNWNQASSDAGLFFGYDRKTDFGYGGDGKKDVANNNNPVESHPQVATGGASIVAEGFLRIPLNTLTNQSMQSKDLLTRFLIGNTDPFGKPDLSLKGALKLNKNVEGLEQAFNDGGKPNVRFDIKSNKFVGLTNFGDVNLNPSKITSNIIFAAALFHEYRHAWQYASGNYYHWADNHGGYDYVENYQERDAYWFQIKMGAGSYFDGYSRYEYYRSLTKGITYKK